MKTTKQTKAAKLMRNASGIITINIFSHQHVEHLSISMLFYRYSPNHFDSITILFATTQLNTKKQQVKIKIQLATKTLTLAPCTHTPQTAILGFLFVCVKDINMYINITNFLRNFLIQFVFFFDVSKCINFSTVVVIMYFQKG